MTTTELIALVKSVEFGGATGRPREVSLEINGHFFMPEPKISICSTGDGLIAEVCFNVDGEIWHEDYEDEAD